MISVRGKSVDLPTESRVSTLNVEDNLSPERTGSSHDKKSERIKSDKEQPEVETGKSPKYIRVLNIQTFINTQGSLSPSLSFSLSFLFSS